MATGSVLQVLPHIFIVQDGEMHLRSQEHANLTEMRRTQGMRDDTGNGYPMNSNSADDGAFDDLETQLSRTLTEAARMRSKQIFAQR